MNVEKFEKPENILIISVFVIVLFLSIEPIKKYDVWWHLKTGEIIFTTGRIPSQDIFSYTKAGAPWINHEWLSQSIFYLVFRALGLYGLVILKSAVLMLSFFIIYKRNQLFLNGYSNALSMAAIIMLSHVSWITRPVIFTFLFIPLTLYLLDVYCLRGRDLLWLIPLIFLIWANLHGSFIIGLLLLFFYAAFFLSQKRETGIRLFKVFAASAVAALLNPNTYHLLLYPLQYATSSVHSKYIVEWQSPGFHTFSAFEGALLLSIALFALSKKVEPLDIVLVLVFTHLGLFAQRNTSLYALVALPILFRHAQMLALDKLPSIGVPQKAMRKFTLSFSLAFLVFGAGVFGYSFYNNGYRPLKDSPVDYGKFPVKAAEYLLINEKNLSRHNMFNTYEWGGYLIWRLYPEYKVFIDGRADVYGGLLEEYYNANIARPETDEIFERYNVSLVLIRKGSALDGYLEKGPRWRVIYGDNTSVIYLKESKEDKSRLQQS